jgi:hypothetical protein
MNLEHEIDADPTLAVAIEAAGPTQHSPRAPTTFQKRSSRASKLAGRTAPSRRTPTTISFPLTGGQSIVEPVTRRTPPRGVPKKALAPLRLPRAAMVHRLDTWFNRSQSRGRPVTRPHRWRLPTG